MNDELTYSEEAENTSEEYEGSLARQLQDAIASEPWKARREMFGKFIPFAEVTDAISQKVHIDHELIAEGLLMTIRHLDTIDVYLTPKELKPLEEELGVAPYSLTDPFARVEAAMSLTLRTLREMSQKSRDIRQTFGAVFLGILIDIIRKGLDRHGKV